MGGGNLRTLMELKKKWQRKVARQHRNS